MQKDAGYQPIGDPSVTEPDLVGAVLSQAARDEELMDVLRSTVSPEVPLEALRSPSWPAGAVARVTRGGEVHYITRVDRRFLREQAALEKLTRRTRAKKT